MSATTPAAEIAGWIERNVPADCRPRDVAILVFYHVLGIKNPRLLAKLLRYRKNNTVYTRLKALRKNVVRERLVVIATKE